MSLLKCNGKHSLYFFLLFFLFQLLDFVSMNHASEKFSSQGSEGGWYRIGWAFLKVLPCNSFSSHRQNCDMLSYVQNYME